MQYPVVTSAYAAILGLIFIGLSAWVVSFRAKHKVILGDGGHDTLIRRIRAHANFIEYVPLALLLAALLEGGGAGRVTMNVLLLPLVIARLAHPFGMIAPTDTMQQYVGRGGAAALTWVILTATAILLLLRLF